MVLKFSDPRFMHRTVPSGVDISAEYMFDETPQEDSPISRHFQGKNVLITGVTGFLGPLYLEKLLRIGANRVYVLCRAKDGRSAYERVEQVFQEPIFVKLNTFLPDFRRKVTVINGDLTAEHLGLSNADDIELCRNVEFVIHAAAENRLSKQLWSLIRVNVQGTRELLRLCRRMTYLQLFVYISPVYSHASNERVREQFNATPVIDPDVMIDITELVHRDTLELVGAKISEDWPDTYAFSRALAEEVVRRNSNRVSTTVVRPSMITSTSIDPIPGWTNSAFGLNGLLTGLAFGFIRLNRVACNVDVDLICADFVVNSTLAIVWDVCKSKSNIYDVPRPKVFHVTSGTQNAIKCDLFQSHLLHVGSELQTQQTIPYPLKLTVFRDREVKFLNILLSLLPAFFIDCYNSFNYVKSTEKRPKLSLMCTFRRLKSYIDRMKCYSGIEAKFDNQNVLTVYNRMTEFDKSRFPSDVRQLNWKQYIYEYALGLRLYLVKEPFETVKPVTVQRNGIRQLGYFGVVMLTLYIYMGYFMF